MKLVLAEFESALWKVYISGFLLAPRFFKLFPDNFMHRLWGDVSLCILPYQYQAVLIKYTQKCYWFWKQCHFLALGCSYVLVICPMSYPCRYVSRWLLNLEFKKCQWHLFCFPLLSRLSGSFYLSVKFWFLPLIFFWRLHSVFSKTLLYFSIFHSFLLCSSSNLCNHLVICICNYFIHWSFVNQESHTSMKWAMVVCTKHSDVCPMSPIFSFVSELGLVVCCSINLHMKH